MEFILILSGFINLMCVRPHLFTFSTTHRDTDTCKRCLLQKCFNVISSKWPSLGLVKERGKRNASSKLSKIICIILRIFIRKFHCPASLFSVNARKICIRWISGICCNWDMDSVFFGCSTCHKAASFPGPGIKPVAPAVEMWSLNHWNTREVLRCEFFNQ